VEEEQKTKLESVAALQDEQRSALGNLSLGDSSSRNSATGGGGGSAQQSSSGTHNSSSSVVSQQIDALFAQLSTSQSEVTTTSKQTTMASSTQTATTPSMTSNVITNSRIDSGPATSAAAAAKPATSNMMSLRPAPNNTPPTWNNNNINGTQRANATAAAAGRGGVNKDPVSSMIHSNLSAMGGMGAIRPANQWSPAAAAAPTSQPFAPPTWGQSPAAAALPTAVPIQQPQMRMMATPLIPQSQQQQQPQFNQQQQQNSMMMMMMPQSTFVQPGNSTAPAAFRPLARSDIDDLLS
jgi:hypothetical protein